MIVRFSSFISSRCSKRDFFETLKKPSKVNLPVSIPEIASAVAKAVGPGTETTSIPSS